MIRFVLFTSDTISILLEFNKTFNLFYLINGHIFLLSYMQTDTNLTKSGTFILKKKRRKNTLILYRKHIELYSKKKFEKYGTFDEIQG